MDIKRVFLIVLDSLGIGEMSDADRFNDKGSNTLLSISKSKEFEIKNLKELGLFNIDGVTVSNPVSLPKGAYGRFSELSDGKDTTTGHWEIAGLILNNPFPTFPDGFPNDIINEFKKLSQRGVLCNKPYSGTKVIEDFGEEHIKTGDLIVYTSADSVFQIAAHEDIVPIEELYSICEKARELLNPIGVGRVIARPFKGTKGNFYRTENRHDYSLIPPKATLLNDMENAGYDVISIGKISDIFADSGITKKVRTKSNEDGMAKTYDALNDDFNGLCFTNLVDFDMLFGHRNDCDGYARALTEFDKWLPQFIEKMKDSDLLMITSDHGCDPCTPSTDHSREHTFLIAYNKNISPVNLGTRNGFCDIGKTIADIFNINTKISGESFKEVLGI